MKKKMLTVLLAAAMTVSLAGCGSKDADKKDNASVQNTENAKSDNGSDRTQFVVGFDAEFPPYGYMDEDGDYTGFDLELAQEGCDRNGWELVKKPINWDSKDMELESGSIDCIWNGFTMNGREDDYTFSDPYVDNSIVVVVAKDSDINKLSDLAGKVVDVQADSSGLAAVQGDDATDENKELTASFAELQQVADYNTAFMNLESGAVDAVVLDIGVAKYQMSSRGDAFRMLDEQVSSEQYAIGFKKGNTELKDQVQKTLDEMVKDGTFTTIVNNYTDYNLPEMVCLGE